MFVIIGASGYLGSYLIKNILDNSDEKVIATYNSSPGADDASNRVEWVKLDISEPDSVNNFCKNTLKSDKYKFIYLAAYHHPDKVEESPKKAWDVNIASLDGFLNKAKPNIESLYYASTDSVYGESLGGHIFSENEQYSPVNTYGRTKAMAEQVVLMHGFSVLRYSLLMGPSLIAKKHFYDVIVESLKERKDIDMFGDSFRSVISFDQAAYYTVLLLQGGYQGGDVVNVAGGLSLSKFDIAAGIAKKLSLDSSFIKNTSIEQCGFGSKRAKNTLISNNKLKGILKLDSILYDYA